MRLLPAATLLVAAGLAMPGVSFADECLTNLSITAGRDAYDYSLAGPGVRMEPVGTWEADRGGAGGSDYPTIKFDQNWVSLSAQYGPMESGLCIVELTTYHAPYGSTPTVRGGQTKVGTWDVDRGGSSASAGGGGDDLYTLGFARMSPGSRPGQVITKVALNVADSNYRIIPSGYNWVGSWDTKNSWLATMSWNAAPYRIVSTPTAVMTGYWDRIGSCAAGRCSELRTNTTVGSEKSFRSANINTQSKEVSIMVGAEMQTDSGKLVPGVSVTARMEVTGTFGQETTHELETSLVNNRQESIEISCAGPSSAWLWVSSIRMGTTGLAETVNIRDRNYVCAGANEQPPITNDISWKLNFGTEDWIRVAGENQGFTLTRPTLIRFGVGNSSSVRLLQPGPYTCNSSGWGGIDPTPGTVKACERPREWVRCASDFETCNWSGGPRRIRYGISPKYIYLDSAASGVACQPSSFGNRDPSPGVVKRCWYKGD